MWKNSLLIVLFLFSCISQSKTESPDFKNITIQCSLKNQKDIYISFLNNGALPVNIKRPCIFNVYIDIKKDGKPLTTKIRVKTSPECMYPVYILGKGESKEFKYNYNVDELFDLEDKNGYKMSVAYYIYDNNKFKQKIISDGYGFIWSR